MLEIVEVGVVVMELVGVMAPCLSRTFVRAEGLRCTGWAESQVEYAEARGQILLTAAWADSARGQILLTTPRDHLRAQRPVVAGLSSRCDASDVAALPSFPTYAPRLPDHLSADELFGLAGLDQTQALKLVAWQVLTLEADGFTGASVERFLAAGRG